MLSWVNLKEPQQFLEKWYYRFFYNDIHLLDLSFSLIFSIHCFMALSSNIGLKWYSLLNFDVFKQIKGALLKNLVH